MPSAEEADTGFLGLTGAGGVIEEDADVNIWTGGAGQLDRNLDTAGKRESRKCLHQDGLWSIFLINVGGPAHYGGQAIL